MEEEEGIQEMANAFFQNLYEKEEGIDPTGILNLLTNRVNSNMNTAPTNPFSATEISDALF